MRMTPQPNIDGTEYVSARQGLAEHEVNSAGVVTLGGVTPERLGQNFLADAAWRERIARAVLGCATAEPRTSVPPGPEARDSSDDVWVEIGAGHGEMTALLARQVGRLMAIELDTKLLPRLRENTAKLGNVTIVSGDVLSLDLPQLAGYGRYRVYGNIPYYITSPIVHRLFEHSHSPGEGGINEGLEAAFLVVQLEVAARLAARPGSRDYGYLSTFTQFYAQPEILLRIPSGAFRPRPKVASALIALRAPGECAKLEVGDERAFLQFLKVCFAQKRKTLRNNLLAVTEAGRVEAILRECGIPPAARAEQITLEQFARIFAAIRRTQSSKTGR
jgi:16S rRNA (adenine1518-N6/adenine1519-N6)-dimethyltransferase